MKTPASRTVIDLQMSAPQEAVACPGTGAAAVAVPAVLQNLLLHEAGTVGGTAASA